MRQNLDDMSFEEAYSALRWQVELGVDEAISETTIDRFCVEVDASRDPKERSNIKPVEDVPVVIQTPKAAPEVASMLAGQCDDLEALKNAMALFDLCRLKEGARQLVFADGVPEADLMIIGEAPGRDEDRLGKPFVGRAGQLLDAMFEAIDRGRARDAENAIYITNVLPWRPPQNRDPNAEEIAMMIPFLYQHVALVKPKLIVLMGNIACQAVLGQKGITKLRGKWVEPDLNPFGVPIMPMFHPAALLRDPLKKRDAWSDLQDIRDRINS